MMPLGKKYDVFPYLEQWDRVDRWFKRLMQVKHGQLRGRVRASRLCSAKCRQALRACLVISFFLF